MKLHSSQSGFSLVELMMVVGIIGMLSVMSQQGYWQFRVKAMQIEAHTSLRTIDQLIESYAINSVLENPNQFLVASASYTSMGSPLYLNALSGLSLTSLDDSDFFSGKRSCDSPNPLGFSVRDCNKAGYKYRTTSVLDGGIAIGATEVMLGRERRVHGYVDCGRAKDWKIATENNGSFKMYPEKWRMFKGNIFHDFNPATYDEFCNFDQ